MHNRIILTALLAAVLTFAFAACSSEPEVTVCDRDCIIGITDAYLSALVAHDPGAAPLAENIAFVEDITKMSPGEGLWESAVSGPDSFAICWDRSTGPGPVGRVFSGWGFSWEGALLAGAGGLNRRAWVDRSLSAVLSILEFSMACCLSMMLKCVLRYVD